MTAVVVRGRYVDALGEPAAGHVRFTARPAVVYDAGTQAFIVGQSRSVTLDGAGGFEVELRATDDPDLQPVEWTYQVREWVGGEWLRPAFDIDVPVAAVDDGIELGDVAPVVPSSGTPTAYVTLAAFEALEDRVDTAEADITAAEAGLAAEATARANADTAEATARANADTAEAVARAAGDAAALAKAQNLADLPNADTARSNLGLGTAATQPATAFDAAGAAAALSVQVTTYLSGSGNYQIPAGAKALRVEALGGGGPGGSGRRGAAGTVRCGGGGGGGGAWVDVLVNVAELVAAHSGSSSIPYAVAPATAGAAAQTANDTNGNGGSNAAPTTFGTYSGLAAFVVARGGGAGAGGTTSSGTGGFGVMGSLNSNGGQNASTTGAAPGNQNPGNAGAAAGGAGGGITSADSPSNGGTPASPQTSGSGNNVNSGAGGVVGGAAPTSGVAFPRLGPNSGPGGGAASITAAAQAGANALPNSGAGGGGGGASLNGNASGAGGAGGSGYLRVTAYF